MLRLVVLLLVLLNAAYYAWSHGLLRAYGWAPAEQREPQRLEQQLRPQAIQILPPEEGRKADAWEGGCGKLEPDADAATTAGHPSPSFSTLATPDRTSVLQARPSQVLAQAGPAPKCVL